MFEYSCITVLQDYLHLLLLQLKSQTKAPLQMKVCELEPLHQSIFSMYMYKDLGFSHMHVWVYSVPPDHCTILIDM